MFTGNQQKILTDYIKIEDKNISKKLLDEKPYDSFAKFLIAELMIDGSSIQIDSIIDRYFTIYKQGVYNNLYFSTKCKTEFEQEKENEKKKLKKV